MAPFWIQVGVILGAKCATILMLGPLGLDFDTLLLHLIISRFLMIFWVQLGAGGSGVHALNGEGVPAPVCFNI